jgi:hypothetical protein
VPTISFFNVYADFRNFLDRPLTRQNALTTFLLQSEGRDSKGVCIRFLPPNVVAVWACEFDTAAILVGMDA